MANFLGDLEPRSTARVDAGRRPAFETHDGADLHVPADRAGRTAPATCASACGPRRSRSARRRPGPPGSNVLRGKVVVAASSASSIQYVIQHRRAARS